MNIFKRFLDSCRLRLWGKSAAVAYLPEKHNGESDFNSELERLCESLKPCAHTALETAEYLIKKYKAAETEISENSLTALKISYITAKRSELLKTPEPKLSGKLSRRELQENSRLLTERYNEAKNIPLESLYVKFKRYEFYNELENGNIAHCIVSFEMNSDFKTVNISLNTPATGQETQQMQEIVADIELFAGVSESDIKNRTPRFLGYATAYMMNKRRAAK